MAVNLIGFLMDSKTTNYESSPKKATKALEFWEDERKIKEGKQKEARSHGSKVCRNFK